MQGELAGQRVLRRLASLFFIVFLPHISLAQPQTDNRNRVIVVLAPGLGPDMLDRVPTLQRLAKQSLVGWMNVRTARVPGVTQLGIEQSEIASSLSLGSGTRAAAPRASKWDFQALQAANEQLDHTVPIGRLGDLLHAAGVTTEVIGSGKVARLVAMDSNGNVDRMIDATQRDPTAPYGIRDNLDNFNAFSDADVIVWRFGDIVRAGKYARLSLPQVASKHLSRALDRFDHLLERAEFALQDGRTHLLILSPVPPVDARPPDHLAPILLTGPGIPPWPWLTSPSTRRPCVVTNYDFLPTVCSLLGIAPPRDVIGRAMRKEGMTFLISTSSRWSGSYRMLAERAHKQAVFGGLPTIQWVCVMASTALLLAGIRRGVRFPAMAVMVLPLVLLVVIDPIWPLGEVLITVWIDILIGIALLAWVSGFTRRWFVGSFPCMFAGLICLDLLDRGLLLQSGLMSYSVMEGARYYGIGNEYGGAVIGAILAVGCFLPTRRLAVVAALIGTSILIGLPQYGADLGVMLGGLVAAGGFAACAWPSRRKLIIAGALVAVIIAGVGLLVLDSLRGAESQSHIGRALSVGVVQIASRKLWLNLYLVTHSPWSLALITSLGAIYLIRRRLPNPEIDPAIGGLVAGVTALFLFNDSGVVAAACCALQVWAATTLVCEGSRRLSHKGVEGGHDSDRRSAAAAA